MEQIQKATTKKLGALHGAVADVLTSQVLHKQAEIAFDSEGNSVETGVEVYDAPPATLAAAIKFLKANAITADVEHNQNMNQLEEALRKRQLKSRMSIVGGTEAAQVELEVG